MNSPVAQAYLQLLPGRPGLKGTLHLPDDMLTEEPAVVTVRTRN